MEKNNRKVFIMILSLALVIISGTFAWLSWRTQKTSLVLTVGDIRGLTVSLKPYQINATLSPVSAYTDGIVIDVTADNKKTEADNFKLFYKIDTIDNALKDQSFKYTITKCTANCANASNYTLLNAAGGNFVGANNNSNLPIYQESVPANTTYKYKVYLWIDSSGGNQSNMQNKTFTGELRASVSETLYTMMRDNAVIDNVTSQFVTSSTGVNFNAISSDTNGKGLYIRSGTENDAHPIYYYRGAVTDNNVLFGGFCWKIVRTTSTGGTKLIYNGVATGANQDKCENATGDSTQLSSPSPYNSLVNSKGSPADLGYMIGARYEVTGTSISGLGNTYYFGGGYTYQNGSYTLTDTVTIKGTEWDSYYTSLTNHKYTCLNISPVCATSLYYIYTIETGARKIDYIELPYGKTPEMLLDEMLTISSNTSNSVIKTVIDTWYANNMTDYTSYLEDTPWCNDRTIYMLKGWQEDGGDPIGTFFSLDTRRRIYVSPYIPGTTCSTNDSFTVNASNGNGKLIYPVGLLTADEVVLAGGKGSNNTTYYLYTGNKWWTNSPATTLSSAYVFYVGTTGKLENSTVTYNTVGVRPAVSLKTGTRFSGGSGTATDPYVVE